MYKFSGVSNYAGYRMLWGSRFKYHIIEVSFYLQAVYSDPLPFIYLTIHWW